MNNLAFSTSLLGLNLAVFDLNDELMAGFKYM
jgi:hypothetical protein